MSSTEEETKNNTNDPMPVWIDDTHLDVEWLTTHTTNHLPPCKSCTVEDISNATRLGATARDGATLRLTVEFMDDSTTTLVVKQVPKNGRALSQQLGLAREALFYNELAAELNEPSANNDSQQLIPKVLYAYGDMSTGAKVVIMEDLSDVSVDSGAFFGPGNPNNWKRDLPAMMARAGPSSPSAATVARVTFTSMAQVHATFWCREDLLNEDKYSSWLRGHQWLLGNGKESWEASQNMVKYFWKTCLAREEKTGKPSIEWDPLLRQAVEVAVEGISWEAQTERLNTKNRFTLVHGDFWPGNFMWMLPKDTTDGTKESIRALDWEMVGLGSGPQELGQYVLSNMDPAERRECERDLVQSYFDELQRCGVTNVDWDYCWSEYTLGGLERWMWFLVYFLGQDGMLDWAQFFHNQMASFMHDHDITAADIIQPRP